MGFKKDLIVALLLLTSGLAADPDKLVPSKPLSLLPNNGWGGLESEEAPAPGKFIDALPPANKLQCCGVTPIETGLWVKSDERCGMLSIECLLRTSDVAEAAGAVAGLGAAAVAAEDAT